MVSLPVFGDVVGVLFPHFDVKRAKDMTADEYVAAVEEGVRDILSEMSDKEYLARRDIGGMMPHLNGVFEELGMHHEEHTVPPKVLKSLEDKAKKAAAKNTTAAVEAKKRKGAGVSKTISKRQRTSAAYAAASTGVGEEVAENVGGGSTSASASM